MFISGVTVGVLLIVLLFVVLPTWCEKFKNRNRVADAPSIEDFDEALLRRPRRFENGMTDS